MEYYTIEIIKNIIYFFIFKVLLIFYIYLYYFLFILRIQIPNPDIRQILQFLEGYPTPGYPRTPYPDKDSKIMDPPYKDQDPDTLKLSGYPIRLMPKIKYNIPLGFYCFEVTNYSGMHVNHQTSI